MQVGAHMAGEGRQIGQGAIAGTYAIGAHSSSASSCALALQADVPSTAPAPQNGDSSSATHASNPSSSSNGGASARPIRAFGSIHTLPPASTGGVVPSAADTTPLTPEEEEAERKLLLGMQVWGHSKCLNACLRASNIPFQCDREALALSMRFHVSIALQQPVASSCQRCLAAVSGVLMPALLCSSQWL
eukprot:1017684-Pelagomonas_calceolata.AAC.3